MKVITFSPDFIAPHESVIYQKSMAPFIVSDLKFIKADCGTEENARLGENIDELYEFAQLSELAQDANNMFRELKIHMMSCELWCTFLKIFAEDLSMCITKSHQTLHIRLQSCLLYTSRCV